MYLIHLLYKVIVNEGYLCIVIGRSKIHGEIVDNATIITQIAQRIGFEPIAKLPRSIAANRKSFNLSHANIKIEHILIFKK